MSEIQLRQHKTIGFIGLGMMGSRMVNHLKGYADLVVFDTNADLAQHVAKDCGARVAERLEAFKSADLVILMLPNSSVIDQVVRGSDKGIGLLDVLQAGALILDMSSATPANSIANAREAFKKGIAYVDAPVSGGPAGAQAATLAIMAGCEPAHFEALEPLFKRLGKNIVHTGEVGSGHAVKALNNLLAATILAATGEVFAAGEKFGLDPAVMQKVISASSGGSYMSSVTWPKAVLGKTWDFGFSLAFMTKDVGIGMSIVNDAGVAAPICHTSAALWQSANEQGHGAQDMTAVVKMIRQEVGLS
jgi:3-hydroxyisobutyrate dehydrogenase